MKVGYCAILGLPNAGKSTFLNAILSKKVSIVSPKPQTTRDDIIGIFNSKDCQIVFIDTPGLFEGNVLLDKTLLKRARSSLSGTDCILYLIDSSQKRNMEDDFKNIHRLEKMDIPFIIAFNKIDLMRAPEMEKLLLAYREEFPTSETVQLSAYTDFNLKEVRERVINHFEEGERYFPVETITDKEPPFMAKEVIREMLLRFLKEEIPHQSAVKINEFVEEKDQINIKAKILVEKDGQKAIVIGKGGSMIKTISMASRKEMMRMWKKRVNLALTVDVSPNWRRDEVALSSLGYGKRD